MWDLVVVGAGPAGASAALSALQQRPDARVLLLDREEFPRDKACGDGIAPHVLDVLRSVGVHGVEAGYAAVERLQIGFASGPTAYGVMARPAYVIPRTVFDHRLVRAAVQRGAEFRCHRVRTVAASTDHSHLILDKAVPARVVVAADGASSVVRRQVSPRRVWATSWPVRTPAWRLSRKPPGVEAANPHTAVAIRGYAAVRDGRAAGQQLIVFSDPDGNDGNAGSSWPAYAWSFPIGDGRANVGYGELLPVGRPLSRRHLLARLDELIPGAGDGGTSWRAHHLPLSTGRPRQPDGRILLAGDAMNLINPFTGEGIFYAVASGALAGRAAVASMQQDTEDTDPGHAYRSLLRTRLGVHLRHTDAAALLTRWPAVVDAAVRAAEHRQQTFDDLVELGLGDGRLTPGALAGIAGQLLRRSTAPPFRVKDAL